MHSTLSFTIQDSTVQDYIFHMTWKVLGVCVNSYAKMCQLVEKEMLCINILVKPSCFSMYGSNEPHMLRQCTWGHTYASGGHNIIPLT
jgi:hypothetical protein